jgi:nitrous oxidase accessory protein NosD
MAGRTYYVDSDSEFRFAERTAPDWSTIRLEKGATFGRMYVDNDKLTIIGDATIDADGGKYALMIAASDVTVSGPEITGSRGSGVSIVRTHDVKLSDVNIHGNGDYGYYASRSDRLTLQDSDIHDNGSAGVSVHIPQKHGLSGFVRIARNHIADNGQDGGVEEWGIIADNDADRRGLPLYNPAFAIRGNTIEGSGSAGILAYHASNLRIEDNFIFNNNRDRGASAEVRFYDSHDNSVARNTISFDAPDRGISFEDGATATVGANAFGTLADPHHAGGALHDDHWTF